MEDLLTNYLMEYLKGEGFYNSIRAVVFATAVREYQFMSDEAKDRLWHLELRDEDLQFVQEEWRKDTRKHLQSMMSAYHYNEGRDLIDVVR